MKCTVLLTLSITVVCVSCGPLREDLYEDGTCTINTKSGVCVLINECPSAVIALKHKKFNAIKRCGFHGVVEVVCCTDHSVVKSRGGVDSPGVIWSQNPPKLTTLRTPLGPRRSKTECDNIRRQITTNVTLFILNGEDAEEEEFPHMASLGYTNQDVEGAYEFRCGGSLISKRYVLTAAHCMNRADALPQIVRLGAINNSVTDLRVGFDGTYLIETRLRHPEYNAKSKINDIALLKLDRDVEYSTRVHPACLYQSTREPTSAVVTGWGITNVRQWTSATILQKASLVTEPVDRCNSSYINSGKLQLFSSQFCAKSPNESIFIDTCQGDSGGPIQELISNDDKVMLYNIVGITSYGSGCAGLPGVYTRVSSYLDWIERNVWPASPYNVFTEGDACEYKSKPGICVLMHNCTSVWEAIKAHRYDRNQRCGFSGGTEIVCCTDIIKDRSPDIREKPTPLLVTQVVTPTPPNGRPSIHKCTEYENEFKKFPRPVEAQIIAGVNASEGEFPFMVGLGYEEEQTSNGAYNFRCGGSLISKRHVLTAAHCIRLGIPPKIARMGVLNITGVYANQSIINDYMIINHTRHDYNKNTKLNDIALLELDRDVVFSLDIFPICLYQSQSDPPYAEAIGWGVTNVQKQTEAQILQKVNLSPVGAASCKSSYLDENIAIQPSHICTIAAKNGMGDACTGDSGGPLFYQNLTPTSQEILPRLVGITSFGAGCASKIHPGVFTRVASYLDWIEKIVWPS